jgi:hypothetical protein
MPRLMKLFIGLFFVAAVMLSSCKTSTAPEDATGGPSGTLIYDIPSAGSEMGSYSFSSKRETIPFSQAACPSWTPSGEVLYEEPSDISPYVNWKIVLIAANGTNKRVLLDSKVYSSNLSKSPKMSKDASTICFNYWFGNKGASDIYKGHCTLLMKSDGTLLGALDSLFDGSWMPDGSLVLSATVDELYGEKTFYADGLYMLSADRSKYTAIGSGLVKPKHPAASPDGKKVAFSMNNHIWVINTDGTGLRQVTTGDKAETHPCWSPDGKYLACIGYGTFEVTYFAAIAAVPSDKTTTVDLTNDSPYWIKDPNQSSNAGLGRLTAYSAISWK